MNTTIDEQFKDWYGNNDLVYSNDVKNMAFKAWKAGAQAILSQGEPVKPYGYVYVSDGNFLFKQELSENERFVYSSLPVYKYPPSTEALQGEPVSKEILYTEPVYKISLDYGHGIKTKAYYTDGRLQPSTEALQKEKVELIEYARHLRYELELIYYYRLDTQFLVGSNFEKAYTTAKIGLDIPQPKCME